MAIGRGSCIRGDGATVGTGAKRFLCRNRVEIWKDFAAEFLQTPGRAPVRSLQRLQIRKSQ